MAGEGGTMRVRLHGEADWSYREYVNLQKALDWACSKFGDPSKVQYIPDQLPAPRVDERGRLL